MMLSTSCPTKSLFPLISAPLPQTIGKDPLLCIRRPLSSTLQQAIAAHMACGPSLLLARGAPQHIGTLLQPHMPPDAVLLLKDALALARLYQVHSGLSEVRFRLEHVSTDSCRKFHTDHVKLRLLCTYHGLATEWVPPEFLQADTLNERGVPATIPADCIHRLDTGDIALLKGSANAGQTGVVHRSPPVSHLPENQRTRLLLTIDEPTACGMSDDQNPTVRHTAC
ncbi:DUF1826 domain-containing protein [Acetobacter cibinongensis]|uniref:DUF1826 domain-containing protein n=1 Tax=Acetobacter cibinongensis TaxID=146475 RepID=UPI000A3A9969|nr:DUF1826 domain-containing protein [Acetobacter cibinongensis]